MDPSISGNFRFGSSKVSYTFTPEKSQKPTFTGSQRVTVLRALQEINLDPRKTHHLDISMLSQDSFRVVIDDKTVVTITRGQIQVSSEEVKNKTIKAIASSVKNLFRAVVNLFYKPSFPHAALKERPLQQAIKEDYRGLRKGLEASKVWAAENAERGDVAQELTKTINHAKRVEKAMQASNPTRAMEKLGKEFTKEILALDANKSVTIPAGYVNTDGALQPLMLQFKMNGDKTISLEIFADHAEAGARIQPTQIRKFDSEVTEKALQGLLQPLLQTGSQKSLQSIKKGSDTFGTLYESVKEQKMKELAPDYKAPAKVDQSLGESVPSSMGYDQLIHSIDSAMGVDWVLRPSSDKLMAPSTTPADRLAKWLNHVTGKELTGEEKSHLLLSLTEKWVGDQMKQVTTKTPLSVQAEVYQDCLEQIDHAIQKFVGRGGGEDKAPAQLLELKRVCEQKIAEITPKLRRQRVEASQEFLAEKMSYSLSVPTSVPKGAGKVSQQQGVLNAQAPPVTELNFFLASNAHDKLANALSPENMRMFRISSAAQQLDFPFKSTEIEETALRVLNENKEALIVFYEKNVHRPIQDNIEELARFIANPQVVPFSPSNDFECWLELLRDADNPSNMNAANADAIKALRSLKALMQLRELENIPKPKEAAEFVKNTQQQVSTWLNASSRECHELMTKSYAEPNLERKKRLLQEAQERAVEVMRLLPSPGTDMAFGEYSIWNNMEGRDSVQENVLKLQQVIWESQLKLGQTSLPAVTHLQLVKGLAIQQAMILQYPGLNADDAFVMETQEVNKFLSQDLTAQLSADPRAEKDLIALYQFIAPYINPGAKASDLQTNIFQKIEACEKKANLEMVKTNFQRLLTASYMYRTSRDPDFTLHGEEPALGFSFLATKPDLLLKQGSLQVANINPATKRAEIRNEANDLLADVYPSGHPQFTYDKKNDELYTNEQQALLIRENVPFLPIVDNNVKENSRVADVRVGLSFDQWAQYVGEKSRTQALAIPPAALLKLLEIRQAFPDHENKFNLTSYHSDTAVRALAYIADPANTKYLEHEFVQTFLDESLFGSFVMQQALTDYPEVMAGYVDDLQICLELAKDRPEIQSYLLGVAAKMRAHVGAREASWEQAGGLSGMVNSSLPAHALKTGGFLYRLAYNFSVFDGLAEDVSDPFTYRINHAYECGHKLDNILNSYGDKRLRLNLFQGAKGSRYIDTIKNPESQKHHLQLLLNEYKRDLADGSLKDLSPDDFTAIFVAAQALEQPDLRHWVHTEILPRFQAMDQQDQQKVLTSLVNEFAATPIAQTNWVASPQNPTQFILNTPMKTFDVDLFNLSGIAPEAKQAAKIVAIPDSILQRDDIRKALKTKAIRAEEKKQKANLLTNGRTRGRTSRSKWWPIRTPYSRERLAMLNIPTSL